jgi:hypothetical protein
VFRLPPLAAAAAATVAATTTTTAAAAAAITDVGRSVRAARQRAGRPTSLHRSRGDRHCSLLRMVQIGYGERPTSNRMVQWGKGPFCGVKASRT